jgi:O-acetylhomoserine/O-acetylserine sulfhydrylase-like pyridoxal-dependent enzyme
LRFKEISTGMVADDAAWLGLPTSKYYERAKKYLRRGFGGVLSFGVSGGTEGSKAFVDGLRLISNMTKYVHPQALLDQERGPRASKLTVM